MLNSLPVKIFLSLVVPFFAPTFLLVEAVREAKKSWGYLEVGGSDVR